MKEKVDVGEVERNIDEEKGIGAQGETGGVERKNGKEEENGGRSWRI